MCKREEETINNMVEIKRGKMHVLIAQFGVNCLETIKCSEELDELVCDFYRMSKCKKTKASTDE